MNPSNIKNIIFDLGGVVIDLRREDAVEALQRLGLAEADTMLGLYRQEEPFLGLETGRLHAGEFFELIRMHCPGASDVDITEAFNRFLVAIPAARLERLRRLREKMNIVFQDPYSSLNPRICVQDTIKEPLQEARRFTKAQIAERTEELMDLVGIEERLRMAWSEKTILSLL